MTLPNRGERWRGERWWLALAAALGMAACVLWWAPREMLDWQPTLAFTQPWRAWSAAFMHWTPLHLGANLLGCMVVAAFGVAAKVPSRCALAWFAAWPLTHVALLTQPQLTSYGGLSGALHAGVAIAAWHLLRHEQGRRRTIGALVMTGLVVKLGLEQPWVAPTRTLPGWDFAVAPLAHASGAVIGWLCALSSDAATKARA